MLVLLPNLVTSARGLAGPVVAWLLLVELENTVAFWVFILAALTDLVDGWLARQLGSDPEVGALLDPLADKVLTGSAWASLWMVGWAPWWLAGTHLARDAVVAGLWARQRQRGPTWQPSSLGQLMTSYEGTAIGILLFHGPWNGVHWPSVGVAVGLCSLALSVVSGIAYWVEGPPRTA